MIICAGTAGAVLFGTGIGIYAYQRQAAALAAMATPTPSATSTPTVKPTPTPTPSPTAPTKQTVSDDLAKLIGDYLDENNVDQDNIGIYVHDLTSDGTYMLNQDEYFVAASTYKLPLAMLYYEKINAGEIQLSDVISLTIEPDVEEEDTGDTAATTAPAATAAAAAPSGSANSSASTAATAVPTPVPTPEPTPEPEVYTNTVEDALHAMIRNSDNTAATALYTNIGGWYAFKTGILKYSDNLNVDGTPSESSQDNTFTPSFMSDLLDYLYLHKDSFPTLVEDLQIAQPNNYLNRNVNDVMAQKYGNFGGALNAIGFATTGNPYTIAIYTYCEDNAYGLLGDINEICYNYFNPVG